MGAGYAVMRPARVGEASTWTFTRFGRVRVSLDSAIQAAARIGGRVVTYPDNVDVIGADFGRFTDPCLTHGRIFHPNPAGLGQVRRVPRAQV